MAVPPRTDIPRAVPPRSKTPLIIGATILGAAGYYFYQAGGDAMVAQKKAEVDYQKAVDAIPKAQGHPTEKSVEEKAAQVGATVDRTVSEGKARIEEGVKETEQAAQNAKAKLMNKIDEADLKIEKEAAKAKGGIMSWFGK